ncbi:mucin-2 protein [Nocardioides sp.]|uniref:mucin-2 protein n=1 Tax=Nocardioides sp. TaxID=35761 RepID=UPI002ED0FA7D
MAEHRHKRETNARIFRVRIPKAPLVAAPLAVVATLSTVGAGVLAASPETRDLLAASSSTTTTSSTGAQSLGSAVDVSERAPVVSRSGSRIEPLSEIEKMLTAEATAKAIRRADTKLWTTADLNLWTTPQEATAENLGEIDAGKKVLVTGREAAGKVEVVIEGEARWVTAGYLSDEKPEEGPPGLGGSCTNGSSVSGSANILAVHEAVCAAFPELTSYGTYRGDGEHAQGIAIDIMVSGDRGQQVAEFVRAHYAELGVSYVIYSQQIWSVDRAGEGWRYMSDRGSTTANHYDHVHVTTY